MDSIEEIDFYEYTPEDFDGLIACVEDFFMGGYPYTDFLDRDKLERMIKDGDIIMTLGKTESGKVVSTAAAERKRGKNGSSVTLFLRCVLDGYRGRGIATSQETYLLSLIEKRYSDALSVYAEVVTNDDFSQRTLCHRGFYQCGFMIDIYKNEVLMPRLKFKPNSRMTLAVYTKPISAANVEIYPVSEHLDKINEIYRNMKISVTSRSTVEPSQASNVSIKEYKTHKTAVVTVDDIGDDFADFVPKIKAFADGHTVIAKLNMLSPAVDTAYKSLKNLGFYFTGIMPLSADGEYILMANSKCSHTAKDGISLPDGMDGLINYIIGGII